MRQGVRVSVIGSREGVPADILAMIEEAEALTAGNRKLQLIFAFNYGARNEIARAVRAIAGEVKAGTLDPAAIDEATIASHLDTAGFPDPDLIIRTGREIRLSNFLLWQSAYAELVFLEVNWPDFGRDALGAALETFATRSRRYGGTARGRARERGARDRRRRRHAGVEERDARPFRVGRDPCRADPGGRLVRRLAGGRRRVGGGDRRCISNGSG